MRSPGAETMAIASQKMAQPTSGINGSRGTKLTRAVWNAPQNCFEGAEQTEE
jgi:hypothetical protein